MPCPRSWALSKIWQKLGRKIVVFILHLTNLTIKSRVHLNSWRLGIYDVPLINVYMYFLFVKDFVSLDGFLGDISDDEIRHRKSSTHRGPPGRRKPEKVTNS